jgi:hypothetical protein
MLRYLVAAIAVVSVCGKSAPAPAGLTVSPQVTGLLSQFPAGGTDLRAAVAELVETDPFLVDEVVFAARNATPSQREAIGGGLAAAASYFAICGNSCGDVERLVRVASYVLR